MTKTRLVILIIPIIFLYLMVIVYGLLLFRNIPGLIEINRLGIIILFFVAILGVAIYLTIRVYNDYKNASK